MGMDLARGFSLTLHLPQPQSTAANMLKYQERDMAEQKPICKSSTGSQPELHHQTKIHSAHTVSETQCRNQATKKIKIKINPSQNFGPRKEPEMNPVNYIQHEEYKCKKSHPNDSNFQRYKETPTLSVDK